MKVTLSFSKGVLKDVPSVIAGLPGSSYQGFCSDARHVRFQDGVAQKMKGYSVYYATAAGSTVNGLWTFVGSDSNTYIMRGSKDTMTKIVSGTGTNLSTSYTGRDTQTITTDATPWSFANFGTTLLFTNGVDNPQKFGAANYTAVYDITNASVADVIRVFKRHCFLIGISGYPRTVKWSNLDDYEDWTPTAVNDAGSYIFYDSRTRLVGGDVLQDLFMVYSEDSLFAMQYIGGTSVFATKRISANAGLWKKALLASILDKHFFMGKDNFYTTDGVTVAPIGAGIQTYVWDLLNTAQISTGFAFTNAYRGEVYFCVPTTLGGGQPDLACIYNFNNGTWTFDDITWTCGIDRIPLAYPLIAVNDNTIQALESTEDKDGVAYTGYVDSAEQGADTPDLFKQVMNIYPVIESSATNYIRFQIGFRDNVNSAITWSAYFNLTVASDYKLDTRSAGSGRLWTVRVISNDLATPFKIGSVICEVESAGGR